MKKKKTVRNIIILLLVLVALGGGITVGVRHLLANQAQSVEVFPVSQMNAADWINYSNEGSVSGTVVSDVSQQVYVPDDKVINEVYVTQGDKVKIGDKLLSYDTTLLELDHELQELTVQEIELEIESAQADLKKLRNTTPVEKSSSDDDDGELLGPNLTLPGSSDDDDGDMARMMRMDNTMLASADAGQSGIQTEAAGAGGQETLQKTAPETEAAQTENAPQTEASGKTGNVTQTETSGQTETEPQPGAALPQEDGQGSAAENPDEEQLITNPDYMNIEDALGDGAQNGASGGSIADILGPEATEKKPALNQSLEKLLAYIRVKEPGEQEEVLLADTREQGDTSVTAQLSQERVKIIPHFRESGEAHFERLNTYTMLIKGITLTEDRSGMLYGIARIDGNDYPEIGGYTLIRDDKVADVAHLTLAFHDGLEEQHAAAPELEDMYAEIELYTKEITGDVLIFRTAKEESDIRVNVQKPDVPQTESEPGTVPAETETGGTEQSTTETETAAAGESEMLVNEPETEGTGTESETESETGTETETETEEEAVPQNLIFDITWYHGSNAEARWPHSVEIDFYEKTDTDQADSIWHQKISGSMEPEEEPDTENPDGEEEPEPETEALMPSEPETEMAAGTEMAAETDVSSVTQDGDDPSDANTYSTVHWVTEPLQWTGLPAGPQSYDMVVRPKDSLNYIPRIAWGRTDENGTKTCTITMTYLEPDVSPITKLEPLSELDFWTGENGLYYKGSGTKEDPYVFFCIDGATIKSSFVNWVLGFNEDGTERMREADGTERTGYYVKLEIRESDTITGAFIKSVGLDGTIRMEYGYGPGTYWIFSSDTGIVRYEEEVPDDTDMDPGWDPGWSDMGETYTAEELANAIAEKEREIRKLNVNKREAELKLKSYEKDLKESTVVSSVDGYVKSVGDSTNGSDAYMVVASEGGLYLKTTVSEMNLDTVEKGDLLEATSWETMNTFSATITEVSYFPDSSSDGYFYYGNTNPNSSNYPVLARIEDTDGLSPYDMVEVKFKKKQSQSGSIYLPTPYIRSENGQSYVYKVGENGLLKKQYVHTGSTVSGNVEIKSGLSVEDSIAFPYGKSVKDGAKIKTQDDDDSSMGMGYGVG